MYCLASIGKTEMPAIHHGPLLSILFALQIEVSAHVQMNSFGYIILT